MNSVRGEARKVTVPAAYLRTLAASVEDAGHDIDDFLSHESLSRAALDSDEPKSAETFGRLFQRAILLLDDESLGMAAGGRTVSGTFRMMCLCVIGCATLGSVVRRSSDFVEICQGVMLKPDIVIDRGQARLGFATTSQAGGRTAGSILADEGVLKVRTTLFFWFNLLGWFAGRSLSLSSVDFSFPAPAHGADWQRLFGCPIRFGAARSALVLPAHAMALPNVQNEQTLEEFLKETPYRLIVPSFVPPSLAGRLRAMLGQSPWEVLPTAEAAAARLGLSVSSLRRRLAEEGTSWKALKEEGRQAAARRYLADTDLPLTEIASLLGFVDPSTFFRAFRRWTGITPTHFRQAERSSPERLDRKRH